MKFPTSPLLVTGLAVSTMAQASPAPEMASSPAPQPQRFFASRMVAGRRMSNARRGTKRQLNSGAQAIPYNYLPNAGSQLPSTITDTTGRIISNIPGGGIISSTPIPGLLGSTPIPGIISGSLLNGVIGPSPLGSFNGGYQNALSSALGGLTNLGNAIPLDYNSALGGLPNLRNSIQGLAGGLPSPITGATQANPLGSINAPVDGLLHSTPLGGFLGQQQSSDNTGDLGSVYKTGSDAYSHLADTAYPYAQPLTGAASQVSGLASGTPLGGVANGLLPGVFGGGKSSSSGGVGNSWPLGAIPGGSGGQYQYSAPAEGALPYGRAIEGKAPLQYIPSPQIPSTVYNQYSQLQGQLNDATGYTHNIIPGYPNGVNFSQDDPDQGPYSSTDGPDNTSSTTNTNTAYSSAAPTLTWPTEPTQTTEATPSSEPGINYIASEDGSPAPILAMPTPTSDSTAPYADATSADSSPTPYPAATETATSTTNAAAPTATDVIDDYAAAEDDPSTYSSDSATPTADWTQAQPTTSVAQPTSTINSAAPDATPDVAVDSTTPQRRHVRSRLFARLGHKSKKWF